MTNEEFPIDLSGDLIAVLLTEEVNSDIKLPDWKRSYIGTVIAMGPGKDLITGEVGPMQTELGDKVSFGAAIGMDAGINGIPIRIMRDTDVDFVFNENKGRG